MLGKKQKDWRVGQDCSFSPNAAPPNLENILHLPRRQSMKQSTEDKAKGTFHEVKGKVKEKVGRATNNPDLEIEGQVEKVGGKIRKKIGQVEKVLGK